MSAPAIDQFLLYDQALFTWVNNTLPVLLPGRTTQLLIATPKRVYADILTSRVVDNETLTLPRITLTRLDHANDPTRYNTSTIRRLGWDDAYYQRQLKRGRFPAPIIINYQLDLWTRHVKEMNLWEQKILWDFAPSYIYLTIRPDDVWQDKRYLVKLDGPINDTSELEPGADSDRAIRKTLTLRAECWLFDQNLAKTGIVKAFEFQWRNLTDTSLYELQFLPPIEQVATGNGVQTSFAFTLTRPPILEHTLLITTVVGGTSELTSDNGAGVLAGNRSSGTINYTSGAVTLVYTSPPDAIAINSTYFHNIP